MIQKIIYYFRFLGLMLSISSCFSSNNNEYTPKPKGFNKIELPKIAYQPLEAGHPFTFEYSKSAIIQPDTFGKSEPHWLIVYYPSLNARVQLTYKPLNHDLKKLDAHISDAFKLAQKHQVKATSQEEQLIQLKNGRKAVAILIEGEVPSHYQFYTTDTLNHYLRGAVYLTEATKNDSLRPIIDFVKADCRHLLETLRWK